MKGKKLIRTGVFETNSSSVHTLSIGRSKKSTYEYLPPPGGVVVITGGDYGWGYERLDTWLEKADYLATDAQYREGKYLDLLRQALMDGLGGGVEVKIAVDEDSYVDHQSIGEVWDTILQDRIDLQEFLFNPKYSIIIDNDNH